MAEKDDSNTALEFRSKLKSAIEFMFVHHVIPHSVLHVFPEISHNVLTQADKEKVEAEVKSNGNINAARVLLNCVVVYNDWFTCLLQVLRHHEVKLSHVADIFEHKHERIYLEFYGKPYKAPGEFISQYENAHPPLNEKVMVMAQSDCEKPTSTPTSALADSLSTLALQDDYVNNIETSSQVVTDHPMMRDGSSNPLDVEELYGSGPCTPLVTEVPQTTFSEGQESPVAIRSKQRPLPEVPSSHYYSEAVLPNTSSPFINKDRAVHGPEYDFSCQETTEALRCFTGWQNNITERKVEETLHKLRGEDGHYILWYWDRKKRPGLCVTHKKKIKTYIVHKRLPKMTGKILFYIDRKGKHDIELQTLVEHHLDEGINDMKGNESITFRFPVLPLDKGRESSYVGYVNEHSLKKKGEEKKKKS